MDMLKIKALADILKNSKSAVFFGGAGVSTESGLKDYRSEDGIYNTVTQYGCPPEKILSHDFFYSNTETFYAFYRDFFLCDAKPNAAHLALAKLEEAGHLSAVVTQNVDGLHQAAGNTRVYELHGTTARYTCTQCGVEHGAEHVRGTAGVPCCTQCGSVLKPKVVLYGEALFENTVWGAIDAIAAADTLIVGGTSLAVYPAASFLRYFRGDNTVIINKQATDFDDSADLVFHESIGAVLTKALELMGL